MALWRTRSSTPDQNIDSIEDHHKDYGNDPFQDQQEPEENVTSHLIAEDAKMTKIYSAELPINVRVLEKTFTSIINRI